MSKKLGIEDTSQGQCDHVISIAGASYRCDLAVEHDGWPHSNTEAEALWR